MFALISETGSRPVNEDFVITAKHGERQCFVLCDGLGGHGMGDVASQFICNFVKEKFEADDSVSPDVFFDTVLPEAEKELVRLQHEKLADGKMRTTLVAMITDKNSGMAYISHVGDSRLFAFDKDGDILFRTLDHSIPEMLRISGQIEEKEIRHHPDRNKILRCMGTGWTDIQSDNEKPFPLSDAGAFLLCSDGFWELCEDADMTKSLKAAIKRGGQKACDEWLFSMRDTVIQNGTGHNMDNFSAIAVLTANK